MTPESCGGPILLSIVGQNENGILRHLSQTLMDLLVPYGFEGHVVDLRDAAWGQQIAALLPRGIAVAWGHAGVGAGLGINGNNLWEQIGVPFVSVLADPPCWMPGNHTVNSRFVANAYLFREWLQVQQRFIRSRQLATLLKPGVAPNTMRDTVAWRDRDMRMVFVKTGEDGAARRLGWQTLPRRSRAVIEDAAAAALRRGTGDVTPLIVEAFDAHNLAWQGRPEVFFRASMEVDLYVRAARSTAFARGLLDLPVDIFGRGWDHIAGDATRARFHPAFDAAGLPALYARTQFLLNTTPNFDSGLHERVLQGLDSRCCVVSDENDASREQLSAIPTFFPVDPLARDLADRLLARFVDQADYTEASQAGVDFVTAAYSGEQFMWSVLEVGQEVRAADQLGMFSCAA